jgi:hypothetical protein
MPRSSSEPEAIRVFSGKTVTGPFLFATKSNLSKIARMAAGFPAK